MAINKPMTEKATILFRLILFLFHWFDDFLIYIIAFQAIPVKILANLCDLYTVIELSQLNGSSHISVEQKRNLFSPSAHISITKKKSLTESQYDVLHSRTDKC